MIPRYTRPEMARIWSDENRFRTWLAVEVAATETLAEAGLVPKDAAKAIRERADFRVERIHEIENEVRLGVINIPALNELVAAATGLGCFFNGAPARVSTTRSLSEALLLATDFRSGEIYGFGPAAERLQARARSSRTWGDCYGYVLVATGRADVMLDPVMNLWDCAPLLPIVEEAGGTFTDWNGVRTIRGGNSIATNGLLFDEVMSLVTNKDADHPGH